VPTLGQLLHALYWTWLRSPRSRRGCAIRDPMGRRRGTGCRDQAATFRLSHSPKLLRRNESRRRTVGATRRVNKRRGARPRTSDKLSTWSELTDRGGCSPKPTGHEVSMRPVALLHFRVSAEPLCLPVVGGLKTTGRPLVPEAPPERPAARLENAPGRCDRPRAPPAAHRSVTLIDQAQARP
jgi:hypothetical protein